MSRLPIRVRVTLLAALAGLLASFAVASLALWRTKSLAERDLDDFLSLEASEVVALISAGGSFASLVDINPSVGPAQRIARLDSSGNILDATPTLPPIPDDDIRQSRYLTLPDPDTAVEMRTLVIPIQLDGRPETLIVATAADFVANRVVRTGEAMIPLVLSAVALLAAGSYVITGLVLKPVTRLTESAAELALRPAGRRLALPAAGDEIKSLAVTINRALDRIDQVMRQNREFVAQASHEIRAPLARLAADLEFTSRPTRTSEEVAGGLVALSKHTDDMVRVADELLDLLEERSVPLEPRSLSVVVRQVREAISSYDDLKITLGCGDRIERILCDPGQVASAVRNLVDNAYEHGEAPVTLDIQCSLRHVDFVVTDGGGGIPPSIQSSIGEPFVRGDQAGRAGLGLAIVSRVAERLGGELVVDMEPVSRLALRLPFVRNDRANREIGDNPR